MGVIRVKEFEKDFLSEESETHDLLLSTPAGEFTLNRKYAYFEGEISGCGVILETDEDSDETCQRALASLTGYGTDLQELDEKLKRFAAETMLESGNDWRSDDDLPPIDEDEFASLISLTGLTFQSDGSLTAYYDDGDIFWGHCIVVNVDSNGNVTDADIAG